MRNLPQHFGRLWSALTWQRFGSSAQMTDEREESSNALFRIHPKRPRVPALHIGSALVVASLLSASALASDIIIAAGAPGDEEFGAIFEEQITDWKNAAPSAVVVRDLNTFRASLKDEISKEVPTQLWIVLIGHGTFDQRAAKFNFAGDDLSAADLGNMIKEAKRPLIIINTTAASAPFLQKLSAPNRILITATKSGAEESYAHFGEYFSKAFTATKEADIDSDGGISLLEAFLFASNEVAKFFDTQGRIATEQALIDDNGDKMGTPAKFFRGVRAIKDAKSGAKADGLRANQIYLVPSPAEALLTDEQKAERDAIEMKVFALREKKSSMDEKDYYTELEKLMLQLAKIYHSDN